VYGSFATKLSMPWSDIDILISPKSGNYAGMEDILPKLDQKMRERPDIFADVKFIPTATIPVVKAICSLTFASKKIDITIQDGKHNGLKCVELVKKYLKTYEALRYLILPFKQLLFNSQMNDPYQGGLSSYGLVLMIIAFLQVLEC
jgi:non-canonical poly(A) RNA polymerase PAPD5/7